MTPIKWGKSRNILLDSVFPEYTPRLFCDTFVYQGKDVLKYELPSAVRRLHVYTEGGGSRILRTVGNYLPGRPGVTSQKMEVLRIQLIKVII